MSNQEEALVNGHSGSLGSGQRSGIPDGSPVQSRSHGGGSSNQYCCLSENGRPCNRPASNASYSKRIQGTVAQRKLKLQLDPKAQHMYICEYHKSIIQTVRTKRKRKDSEDSVETVSSGNGREMIDLFQLQMNTLRRYKKHFKVTSRPGLNKAQLAESLTRHMKTIPVAEKEALTYFIYMIKTNKSKLDAPDGEQEQSESF